MLAKVIKSNHLHRKIWKNKKDLRKEIFRRTHLKMSQSRTTLLDEAMVAVFIDYMVEHILSENFDFEEHSHHVTTHLRRFLDRTDTAYLASFDEDSTPPCPSLTPEASSSSLSSSESVHSVGSLSSYSTKRTSSLSESVHSVGSLSSDSTENLSGSIHNVGSLSSDSTEKPLSSSSVSSLEDNYVRQSPSESSFSSDYTHFHEPRTRTELAELYENILHERFLFIPQNYWGYELLVLFYMLNIPVWQIEESGFLWEFI